jgi:hypothetical protein
LSKKIETAMEITERELERLRKGYERYETARRMNPRQWVEAWKATLSTGKRFDDIIDAMTPAMQPNLKVKERNMELQQHQQLVVDEHAESKPRLCFSAVPLDRRVSGFLETGNG